MKSVLKSATLLLAFIASNAALSADVATPAHPLEIGGVMSGINPSAGTLKIDGKEFIVTTQTLVMVSKDGIDQRVRDLREIPVDKAQVYYELNGKGQLEVLQIVLPPSQGKKP